MPASLLSLLLIASLASAGAEPDALSEQELRPAPTGFQVKGRRDGPKLRRGSSVSLSWEQLEHAHAPLVVADVKQVLARTIEEKGFKAAEPAAADLFLRFSFGTVSVNTPIKSYAHFMTVTIFDSAASSDAGRYVWRGEARLDAANVQSPEDPENLLEEMAVLSLRFLGETYPWTKLSLDSRGVERRIQLLGQRIMSAFETVDTVCAEPDAASFGSRWCGKRLGSWRIGSGRAREIIDRIMLEETGFQAEGKWAKGYGRFSRTYSGTMAGSLRRVRIDYDKFEQKIEFEYQ